MCSSSGNLPHRSGDDVRGNVNYVTHRQHKQWDCRLEFSSDHRCVRSTVSFRVRKILRQEIPSPRTSRAPNF